MDSIAIQLVVGVTIFLLYVAFRLHTSRPTQWPSPPRIPGLGSVPFMRPARFLQQCLEWKNQYGPIIALKIGVADETLLVQGAELLRSILIRDESSFAARDAPWFYSSDLRLQDYLTPFHSASPHVFAQRQLVIQTVKSVLALGKDDCTDRASEALIAEILPLTDVKVGSDRLRHHLLDVASIVAINVGFGMRWSAEEVRTRPEARAIVEATDRIFALLTFMDEPTLAFPFLTRLLPRRTWKIRREARQAAELLLSSHRRLYLLAKSYVANEGEDALEPSVVKSLLSEKGAGMSEFQQMCLAGTTMAAASNSTGTIIHAAIGVLAAMPDLQAQLLFEVQAAIVATGQNPATLPEGQLISKGLLLMTVAFVTEIMRMFPPFPVFSRVATRDYQLPDGRQILTGQKLFVGYYALNRAPEVYQQPESFDPTRFLDLEAIKSIKTKVTKHGHAAFGAGRRICPGADLANHFIALGVARLVYSYEVKFADGATGFGRVKSGLDGVEMNVSYPDVVFTQRREVATLIGHD